VDLKPNKLYTYIGFAARAGKIIYGDFAVEQLLKKRKIRLVILNKVSDSTLVRYESMCDEYGTFCLVIKEDMQELNVAGKANKILGLRDKHFSELIIKEYKNTALSAGVD